VSVKKEPQGSSKKCPVNPFVDEAHLFLSGRGLCALVCEVKGIEAFVFFQLSSSSWRKDSLPFRKRTGCTWNTDVQKSNHPTSPSEGFLCIIIDPSSFTTTLTVFIYIIVKDMIWLSRFAGCAGQMKLSRKCLSKSIRPFGKKKLANAKTVSRFVYKGVLLTDVNGN
jgi:hypothetical protein